MRKISFAADLTRRLYKNGCSNVSNESWLVDDCIRYTTNRSRLYDRKSACLLDHELSPLFASLSPLHYWTLLFRWKLIVFSNYCKILIIYLIRITLKNRIKLYKIWFTIEEIIMLIRILYIRFMLSERALTNVKYEARKLRRGSSGSEEEEESVQRYFCAVKF